MKTEVHPLGAKILRRRGKKSYGLIAKELGTTRNVVAGVIFRHDHPVETRVLHPAKPWEGRNRTGTGRVAGQIPMSLCAQKHLPFGPLGAKTKKKQANYRARNYPL